MPGRNLALGANMVKKSAPDIDTFAIGPSVCKNFTNRDVCHYCVAKGIYNTSLCFARPTGKINTVENEQEKLRAICELAGGNET